MKYIMKYKIRSKYFGFIREYYKEFDSMLDILEFIIANSIKEYKIYKEHYEPKYGEKDVIC